MNEQLQRNPYEPTRVPLIADPPVTDNEPEYGGFWIRVGAVLLDSLFLIPLGLLSLIGFRVSLRYFIYAPVPLMLFHAFYWMYLVKLFGGTPGKRLLKLRIVMADGKPITMMAAIIRNAPLYLLTAMNVYGQFAAARSLAGTDVAGMGFIEMSTMLASATPRWVTWVTPAMTVWYLVNSIVLASNDRRRALHDFLAGTMVLRDQR
jgi:uncharacterized RDD family membrane protein YckC